MAGSERQSTPSRAATGRADARRNRRAILDAGAQCLMENPQASVHDIAERAGLTRATVYRHFPDRDDLLAAVAAEGAAVLVPIILDEMRALPWPEALDLLADRAVRGGAEHREAVLMIAPRLEQSIRSAISGEPIQAELEARRAAGEISFEADDAWLAVCVRVICVAAVSRLTDPEIDVDAAVAELSMTLRRLCL